MGESGLLTTRLLTIDKHNARERDNVPLVAVPLNPPSTSVFFPSRLEFRVRHGPVL